MKDLTLDPGPGLPDGLVIPSAELTERFARSSGPGGQGVNTTDSRVQLSFDLSTTTALTDTQRLRATRRLKHRLVGTVLTVDSSEQRSQHRNREAARARLAAILREALAPPPPKRRATRPTRGSVERRLSSKRRRAETKATRRRPAD
ncbi:ribosome-associated protein [Tessaracoccus bendigoensis DSM 12906]|uniref:Ribosome-associated protein n=1 Tax=Tessaracoccus bendigoensis DSM 12906 TaxID=1123357 RepID=A0A1M6IFX3_9ACTN|nr:alternative ribosome rescue aminoacyl-tRNA hydrolase ArfB [Tessaracoccus bendigoensis]SHJ33303.1 ribosome-associated protein [Tessaracoccus bendigoensis DSM 12906]